MTVQSYCVAADIKHLLSDLGVQFRSDDNQDGAVAVSGTESTAVSRCIEMAAGQMNMIFQNFTLYTLSSLASNEWCKWVNAVKAAVLLCKRRGNSVPASLAQDWEYCENYLKMIQNGVIMAIPGTAPTMDGRPCVTNYTTEPWRPGMPVRRQEYISTGPQPDGTTQSWPAYQEAYDYYI